MLADEMVLAGCRAASSLWIAIKFEGMSEYMPGADLMAAAACLPKRTLLLWEAQDLKTLRWDLVPLATKCRRRTKQEEEACLSPGPGP